MKKAFTLLELLLVIAIVASLAGLILNALNPAQRLQETNETKAQSNANDIEKAINTYSIENSGNLPGNLTSVTNISYFPICKSDAVSTDDCLDLNVLTSNYLNQIPVDSQNSTEDLSGYTLRYNPSDKSINVMSSNEFNTKLSGDEIFEEGLVGYWKMDESSWNGTSGEIKDSSGNARNGVRFDNATTSVGKFGNAGSFDGTGDYARISDFNSLDIGTGSKSWSFWFKTSSNVSTGFYRKSDGCNHNGIIHGINSFGQIYTYIAYWAAGGCNGSYTYSTTINASNNYADGNWHHMTVVLDRFKEKLILYADGNEISQTSITSYTGLDLNADATITLGSTTYQGNIDEFRIYDRALSTSEVSALYGYGPKPIAHWEFDEGSGQILSDKSGNGYNGTLGGTTSVQSSDPTWSNGKYGGALYFDGTDDYVEGVFPGILGNRSNFTIGSWINLNSYSASGADYSSIYGEFENTAATLNYFMIQTNGRFDLDQFGSSSGENYNSNTSVTLSNWHYVAVAQEEGTLKYYLDGNLDRTVSGVEVYNGSSPNVFRIGARKANGNTVNIFHGYIDNLKIYNYARTQAQILEDMNNE